MLVVRLIAALSLLWAVLALAVQARRTHAAGAAPLAAPAGDPRRGLLYNFTRAMLPAHKESVRLHPLKFGLGLGLHAGVLAALTGVGVTLAAPATGVALLAWLTPLPAAGLLAGLALLALRVTTAELRAISIPDDYLAAGATCGLLAAALLAPRLAGGPVVLLAYAAALLVYLPLGKLRHVVFFFVVRAEYGRRLGYRGVYPPVRAEAR